MLRRRIVCWTPLTADRVGGGLKGVFYPLRRWKNESLLFTNVIYVSGSTVPSLVHRFIKVVCYLFRIFEGSRITETQLGGGGGGGGKNPRGFTVQFTIKKSPLRLDLGFPNRQSSSASMFRVEISGESVKARIVNVSATGTSVSDCRSNFGPETR